MFEAILNCFDGRAEPLTSLRVQELEMKFFAAGIFTAICSTVLTEGIHDHDKVVCFWNSTSFERRGDAQFQVYDLQPALSYCTHLVYGFAGINTATLEVVPLHPHIDIRGGVDFYRGILQLKRSHPDLKVCLSIGGNADPYEETHKYLVMTRSTEVRAKFVDSVGQLLSEYNFDCVDLAWQFPGAIGYDNNFEDYHEVEHRDGFAVLVRDLKKLLTQRNNKELTLTVLPRVNTAAYYDIGSLEPNIDAVHLFAFEQKIPEQNSKEADYPVFINRSFVRSRGENVDAQVNYWLKHGTPKSKVVIGIPTFARTWQMTSGSLATGILPTNGDGPGFETPGLLSYTEVCTRLMDPAVGRIRRVSGSSKKYGNYAFWSSNGTKVDRIWVGFEEPRTAGNKAAYTRSKGLGGVAIYDLSLDDFRGICNDVKFPILKAAKERLTT